MTWRWGWILYTWNTLPSGTETTTNLHQAETNSWANCKQAMTDRTVRTLSCAWRKGQQWHTQGCPTFYTVQVTFPEKLYTHQPALITYMTQVYGETGK